MQIQDNFQFPETAVPSGQSRARYPFAALQVGQGFAVKGDKAKLLSASTVLSRFRTANPGVVIEVARDENAIYFRRTA